MAVRNKLSDLNDILFETLERLNDEDLEGEKADSEVRKAKAITSVAGQIVQSAKVSLKAMQLLADGKLRNEDVPEMLGVKSTNYIGS